MAKALLEIVDKIEESFQKNWVNALLFSDAEISSFNQVGESELKNQEQFKLAILDKKFVNVTGQIIDNISLFILQGGYINLDVAKISIHKVLEKTNELTLMELSFTNVNATNQSLSTSFFYEIQGRFWENVINPIKKCCELTQEFLSKLESYADLRKQSVLFNIEIDKSTQIILGKNSPALNSIGLFELILEVSEIDHNLSFQIESLESLIKIHTLLESDYKSLSTQPIYQLLLEKTCFLIHKLITIIDVDRSNEIKVFIINKKYKKLNKEEYNIKHLSTWLKDIQNHYSKEGDNKMVDAVVATILNKSARHDFENLSLTQFHNATKYSKDINKSLPDLVAIHEFYESFYKLKDFKDISKFDLISLNIARNYIANTMLSLAIEECLTKEEIEKKLVEIVRIQSETEIKNFFPYYKAAKRLALLIEMQLSKSFLNSEDFDEKITELTSSINTLKEYLKKWDAYIEWCQRVNYLSYRLTFDESHERIVIGEINYDLFVASSYIIPFDYDAKKIELREYTDKVFQLSNQISILKTSENQIKSINKVVSQVKDVSTDVRAQERKFIEILAVFSAVVLFTSGSIQVFDKTRSFGDSLMFLGVFSISLILFVVLIKSILNERPIINNSSTPVFFTDPNFKAVLISAVIVFIGSFYLFDYSEKKEDERLFAVESRKMEQEKINQFLPLRTPSFKQNWITLLNQYEQPFTKNNVVPARDRPWVEFLSGKSKLLVLAPHATSQMRMDSIKRADSGTGSMAVFLNKEFGVPVLYTTYLSPKDPNYYDDNMFKDTLAEIIKLINPSFVLDLHGSAFSKPYDLDFGTLGNKSYLNQKELFLELINACKNNGLSCLSQDYFPASKNQTNTKWLFKHNIPCVQLEVNSNYLIRHDAKNENCAFINEQKATQLLQALVDFNIVVNNKE